MGQNQAELSRDFLKTTTYLNRVLERVPRLGTSKFAEREWKLKSKQNIQIEIIKGKLIKAYSFLIK